MDDFFKNLLDASDFPARWHCGNWSDAHGWLHVGSDIAVFGAYTTIPLVLGYFITRRRDLPFPRIFWMFVAFIAFCGLSHLTEAYIFWNPIYRVSGLLKLATAIASWATVLSLIRAMPRAMELRSPEYLERQVAERTEQLERHRGALRQANEDLKIANNELRQYAYIVAHDLQSPLRAIKSFTTIISQIRQGDMNELESESMTHLMHGIDHMEALTSDLLAYSRAGQTGATASEIDTRAIVRNIVEDIRMRLEDTPLDVNYEGLPKVRGDETKLRQLFQNLIDNAVKFSGSAPPKIVVRGHRSDTGWSFEVTDHGIGFEPRHSERIFEPFQRLHLPEDYEGNGIGLSIVRKIVQLHGGTIHVRSARGEGASFFFTLLRPPPFELKYEHDEDL